MSGLATALPYIAGGLSIFGTLTQLRGQQQAGQAQQQIAGIQDQSLAAQADAVRQMAAEELNYATGVATNALIGAEFEAMQADYLANQAVAHSQKGAYEERRASGLLASKALSIAAASGAGASDETVVQLIGEIHAEGAYRSALALYEGEEASRSYTIAGLSRRISGESQASAILAEGKSRANARYIEAGSIENSRIANRAQASGAAKANQTAMYSTLISGGTSLLDIYGKYK